MSEITNSPYAYVWNDPVNFADPTGLMGERVGGNDPSDPPAKRSFLRRAIDWLFGRKSNNRVSVGPATQCREPDLPTFSQAPDDRRRTTAGGWIQRYRDYEPSSTDLGGQVIKPLFNGALDFGNFIRNSVFDKSDYSGLAYQKFIISLFSFKYLFLK